MADRTLMIESLSFTAVADAANFTDNGYAALQGGAALEVNKIKETWLGGLATASAVVRLILSLDLVVGATLTTLVSPNANGPNHPSANDPVTATGFIASTTKPQRASSVAVGKMNFGFQAFGGGVRWQAPVDGEYFMVGNGVSAGEASISAFTGSAAGPCGMHMIYETL